MAVLEPTTEIHHSKLWQYLNLINSDYGSKVIYFIKEISGILTTIKLYFPYYTRHDAHHGYKVLKRMEQIVDPKCFDKDSLISFSDDEALLLIYSAYAHDLGMAVFPNEENEILNRLNLSKIKGWQTNPELQQYLRIYHSERGGKYINDSYEQLGIPKNLTILLHELMRAHNLSVGELDSQFNDRVAAGEKEINLKQLACILCIADSLEFSDTRVVDGVLQSIEDKLKNNPDKAMLQSYHENMKHICIGDSVAVGEDGKIIFSGSFDDAEILNLAHQTIDYIEDWLRGYTDIDYRSKPKRLNIRTDSIFRSLKILGSDFERLGIRIKKDNIIDLISSNSIWQSDNAIVLREMLQNSVEACRYRRYHSSTHDDYLPRIRVICNKKEGTITVKDNGCGMSRNIILNNFLTIGNSRSFDSSYTTARYSSLARFGIGFWSVFTIAEHADIITAPFEYLKHTDNHDTLVEGLSFEVSINEAKDYTVFTQIKLPAGTEITLKLKKQISINDILDRLSYHIACSEIPIEIVSDEESYFIPLERTLPDYYEIFGAKHLIAQNFKVKEFVYDQKINDVIFKMKFLYRMDNGKVSFQLPNKESLIIYLNHILSMTHRAVSICGFLSNFGKRSRAMNIESSGFFIANTNNPEGYAFTLIGIGV